MKSQIEWIHYTHRQAKKICRITKTIFFLLFNRRCTIYWLIVMNFIFIVLYRSGNVPIDIGALSLLFLWCWMGQPKKKKKIQVIMRTPHGISVLELIRRIFSDRLLTKNRTQDLQKMPHESDFWSSRHNYSIDKQLCHIMQNILWLQFIFDWIGVFFLLHTWHNNSHFDPKESCIRHLTA